MHFTFLGSACAKDKHCIETCVAHSKRSRIKKIKCDGFHINIKKAYDNFLQKAHS